MKKLLRDARNSLQLLLIVVRRFQMFLPQQMEIVDWTQCAYHVYESIRIDQRSIQQLRRERSHLAVEVIGRSNFSKNSTKKILAVIKKEFYVAQLHATHSSSSFHIDKAVRSSISLPSIIIKSQIRST